MDRTAVRRVDDDPEFHSSSIKTIDNAVFNYFKSLGLKYGPDSKDPAVLFNGMNRSVQYDLKTLRDNGWFPAISISRTNFNMPDPHTYNANNGRVKISSPDFIDNNKTQILQHDYKTVGLTRGYSYTIPRITLIMVEYTILHVSRGRTSLNESVTFSDAIFPYLGTIIAITDPETKYQYEMKLPMDISIDGNFDSSSTDEKEVINTINVSVFGHILNKNTIKRVMHPIKISFNEQS